MRHRRSPTQSYNPTNAALALRPGSTPTLLSPLRSVLNSPDDFQSNAGPPLAGLGITCQLRHGYPFRTHTADAQRLFSLPADSPVQFTACDDLGLDNDPPASDIIGLIPDVNMYDRIRQPDPQHVGVNPLDTICDSFHDPGSPLVGDLALEDHGIVDRALFATLEQSPSPRVIQDIMSILVQPALEFPRVQTRSPSQPTDPASYPSVKLDPDIRTRPSSVRYECERPDPSDPSPVLNAHLGIELGELMSRAEHFRSKHPERDIDRAWLSHFAGKLSDRGELLDDFRCYVVGCDQRNKRRDHILVHVGAHIGQRPFACSVCPLRFLRKNECKRHEASHSGFRPYSCDICGQCFVRQDLVKRHMKRTHALKDENVARPCRRRARTSKRA